MKTFIFTLASIVAVLLGLLLFPESISANTLSIKNIPDQVYSWMCNHWAYLALAASEVAAFLPAKSKGIVQAVLRVGSFIFRKKTDSTQKNLK